MISFVDMSVATTPLGFEASKGFIPSLIVTTITPSEAFVYGFDIKATFLPIAPLYHSLVLWSYDASGTQPVPS